MNILHRVTRKTLRKNKTRTIVTIIGVVLSVAMVTAITSFISSMQDFLLRSTIAEEGNWEAGVENVSYQQTADLRRSDAFKQTGYTRMLGFAMLEGSANDAKPYLCVQAFEETAFGLFGITPIEGRLPENGSELIVSEHIWINGGVQLNVGDTITLPIGDRVFEDGIVATRNYSYNPDDEPETLSVRETKTYTIVGVCARPGMESYSAGGYTVFTRLMPNTLQASDTVSLYVTAENPRKIFETMPELAGTIDEMNITYHAGLLSYMGISQNRNFNAVLFSMAGILIGLIMLGSISLIYNAFAISVSERSRQFGMLSSVGATSRQIKHAVFYEALVISSIGIPLGVLSGVGGIGVTIWLLRDSLSSFLNGTVTFTLSVSVPAVVMAAAVGLLTVLISAYIPARRAARMSAIEAIRQTGDIRLRARQVKTPRFIRRLFGMEGDLALKNFKRNRRRYRATVFSLFISVVLFISVSAYTSLLRVSVTTMFSDKNYSILVSVPRYGNEETPEEETLAFYNALDAMDNITEFTMLRHTSGQYTAQREELDDKLWDIAVENGFFQEDEAPLLPFSITALDEETFARYVEKLGLNLADYTDADNPRAIVLDQYLIMDEAGRYIEGHVLADHTPREVELLGISGAVADGQTHPTTATIRLETYTDEIPLGIETHNNASGGVTLIVSPSVIEQFGGTFYRPSVSFAINAADTTKAEKDINDTIQQMRLGYDCINYDAQKQQNENVLLVFNVLTYGFIVLISLITIANVFNTISTNIQLRRRELAMLRSVGTTQAGFRKMMNFECLFYGLKALLYGLPVSLVIVFLVRAALLQGVYTMFAFPWLSFVVAILCVFLVVFVTMMYAMSKVRRENIVDALKNENQ